MLSPVGAAEGHTSSSPYPRLVHVRPPVASVAAPDVGESACAAAASLIIGRWVACSLSPLLHLSLVEDCRPADVTCFPCGALIGIRLDKSRAASALGALHYLRRSRGSAASGRSDAAPEPRLPSTSKQTKAAISAASSPNRYTPPTRLCGTVDGHRIRPLLVAVPVRQCWERRCRLRQPSTRRRPVLHQLPRPGPAACEASVISAVTPTITFTRLPTAATLPSSLDPHLHPWKTRPASDQALEGEILRIKTVRHPRQYKTARTGGCLQYKAEVA